MMPQATIMLFGYFEIVMDAKIKIPIKFYGKYFTRKMVTLAKSGHIYRWRYERIYKKCYFQPF